MLRGVRSLLQALLCVSCAVYLTLFTALSNGMHSVRDASLVVLPKVVSIGGIHTNACRIGHEIGAAVRRKALYSQQLVHAGAADSCELC